jgi:hypothetical protein
MKTAAELKGYAGTCRALAQNAVTDDNRRLLLEMANTWMLLASGQERVLQQAQQAQNAQRAQQAQSIPFCRQLQQGPLH